MWVYGYHHKVYNTSQKGIGAWCFSTEIFFSIFRSIEFIYTKKSGAEAEQCGDSKLKLGTPYNNIFYFCIQY